ncbi:alpha/beta hydrolase [Alteribacillus iranensis]|uniref:Pimeloyl-ACP methyl ester carboxylesterase n=1 Tax=Alteribacillus iranensis TaxID=930128 RepID=A0A1I2BHV4_9BACI|nr:alpha/beta hydrolase [Alteribacillus iranensis]SFE55649.1 Pimeloyl-ACP methyl ester carboxylesterase [Alteribacillus iranensis]
MPFLDKDGTKIYYVSERALNPDSRETIVFIHTNISDHTIYDSIVSRLRVNYHTVLYDLRGYGKSDRGDAAFSFDTYVDDLRFLIDSLDLGPVYLVSMGFSSLLALKYTQIHEDMVKKNVLISMVFFPEESVSSVRRHRRQLLLGGRSTPLVDYITKMSTVLKPEQEGYRKLRRLIWNVDFSLYEEIMDFTISTDPTPFMRAIRTPSFVLSGEKEALFPTNLLAFNAIYLKQFQYAAIPNASSFIMLDQPDLTASMIEEFFRSAPEEIHKQDEFVHFMHENIRRYSRDIYLEGKNQQNVNTIHVDLLHAFRVNVNGKTITKGWNQRYAKQILVYLLFHQTATRDNMCEKLWPEVPLMTAKRNLRVYLSHLKRVLHSFPTKEPVLVIDREHIFLNGRVTSDALSFVKGTESAMAEANDHRKYEKITHLLSQLSSRDYLTEVYDDWFLDMRKQQEYRLVQLVTWLGEWLWKQDRGTDAINRLSQVVALFEDNEPIFDTLIWLCQKRGDHKQAAYWEQEKEKAYGFW